ncbi:MAG: fatty acid/phospholipid synthesis protein PlsX [Lachnospiraceae bacterium]
MELSVYMKSIIDMDRASVVICDLDHKIIYMNPAAVKRYAKRGGAALVGKSLLDCHNENSNGMIKKVVAWFLESTDNNMIYTYHNEKENKDVYMVALREDRGTLIGYYEKHEYRDRETGKLYDFDHPLTI